jgi:hypothetical protein
MKVTESMDEQFALKVSFEELSNYYISLFIFLVSCICSALIIYIISTIINVYYKIQEKYTHLRFND